MVAENNRLALPVSVLELIDPGLRERLSLASRLERTPIRLDSDKVHIVAFSCDLLTAALICDIIRSNDRKLGDRASPIYRQRSPGGKWVRASDTTVFTTTDTDGKAHLSVDVFPEVIKPEDLIPPSPQKVVW